MASKFILLPVLLILFSIQVHAHYRNSNSSILSSSAMELPDHSSFNSVSTSSCNHPSHSTIPNLPNQEQNTHKYSNSDDDSDSDDDDDHEKPISPERNYNKSTVKVPLRRRSSGQNDSVVDSAVRDISRIQTLYTRIIDKKNQNTVSRLLTKDNGAHSVGGVIPPSPESYVVSDSGQLMATLESGVSHGSGEYFIDVFLGTPPKHFSLILDTGSDLNWIQCVPCYDCFEQIGPHYDPNQSTSFKNITCRDPRCRLVSSPDPPQPCKSYTQTCPYYYWYGDSSNTTGDFATETFTVNLTGKTFKSVENVMFGCGHWNRGLFHGAAGLLGLGRGPLSFSSQLQSLYGHSFSYCLVDRNSDSTVSSKLIFGEDKDLMGHPELNFTAFVGGNDNPVDTFYYVHIKSILIGGETLQIPEDTWNLSSDGSGGAIIDSGTTLSYFADPAYKIIKQAFLDKVKKYPIVKDFPILEPCYNVSGAADKDYQLPSFGILFSDGAVWNFPVENYFIKLEPEEVVCLAILGTPRSGMSIIGNYQQQNFHVIYDTKMSRLGFAPTRCADV